MKKFLKGKGTFKAILEDIGNCSILCLFLVAYSIFSMSI